MHACRIAPALVLIAGLLAGCRAARIVDAPHTGTTDYVACAANADRICRSTPCPVAPRCAPRGEVYVAAQAVAFPAWGPAVTLGQVFARTRVATWSFEVDAAWQDLGEEIGGLAERGEFAQVRGGVKASFLPSGRGHPTARAGFGWFRTTEDSDWIGDAGDYIAFHAGLGFEFDLTARLTTGPEIVGILAAQEGGFDLEFAPQVRWHLIWKF